MAVFLEEECSASQQVPGTKVEPALNSEYATVSDLRLITCNYGSRNSSETKRLDLNQVQ